MSNYKELISVIVPIYNVSNYISTCIKSIINQTYKNLEILLIDDGSTDASGVICDEYAKIDTRIRVIHKKNEGLVRTRKTGLTEAEGKYIAYVDGDDWIEPKMYEVMYDKLVNLDVDMVLSGHFEDVGNCSKVVYHGVEEGYYGRSELKKYIFPTMIVGKDFFDWRIYPSLCDKLFKRECIEKSQFSVDDSLTIGEDVACVFPSILQSDSIYIMKECFYHYRQHPNSMVKKIEDCNKEKALYSMLYGSVLKSFQEYKDICDLSRQWQKFMLFLMLPRSDNLYENFDKLDYLFPFPKVKRGNKIILYGAGTYGQRLYKFFYSTGFCEVIAWVDRNYKELRSLGLNVESPEIIAEVKYDSIVVANTYAQSRKKLYDELVRRYEKDKINMIDLSLLYSSETMEAFGIDY